jgi:hypothetical protein
VKKITIKFQGESFEIDVTKIVAFPNNVYLIEYSNKSILFSIIPPPIYIIEKGNVFSFQDEINSICIDLLHSITLGIEENYNLF